jgi:hypothetical protein
MPIRRLGLKLDDLYSFTPTRSEKIYPLPQKLRNLELLTVKFCYRHRLESNEPGIIWRLDDLVVDDADVLRTIEQDVVLETEPDLPARELFELPGRRFKLIMSFDVPFLVSNFSKSSPWVSFLPQSTTRFTNRLNIIS